MRLSNTQIADVAELADALRSGRSSLYGSVGSTPTHTQAQILIWAFVFSGFDVYLVEDSSVD